MGKLLFSLLLVTLPTLAEARAWTMPSGKVFEEKVSLHYTLSGVPVLVSNWVEILGVIKKANAKELSLRDLIENYTRTMASFYGIDPKETLETNVCESNWNREPEKAITIYGDKGKAHSLAQFHKPTFDTWKKESGMPELEYKSWTDQLKLQAWAFSKGEKYKDDWTCYIMIFIKKTRPISTNWE